MTPIPTSRHELCAEGGFLTTLASSTPQFFGISPREALAMDPQQRLLLEGAWEAFEDAGIDPALVAGQSHRRVRGLMYHDYGSADARWRRTLRGTWVTGSAAALPRVGWRIRWVWRVRRCRWIRRVRLRWWRCTWRAQALRRGECSLALAGGVTVMSRRKCSSSSLVSVVWRQTDGASRLRMRRMVPVW